MSLFNTGGLFGSNTNANTSNQQNSKGGLFGSNSQTAPSTTGGLFGAQPTQSTQPSSGLFGTQSTQPTSGLFGTPATQPTGGLFGAQPAQNSGGLFGTSNSTNQGGLFGTNTQATQPAGGLFGSTTQSATQFGAATQGSNPSQQPSNISLTTKYSELPESFQKELDNIEKFIQTQIQASNSISNRSLEDALKEIIEETEETQRKMNGLRNVLKRDLYAIEQLKSLVTKELRNSDLVTRYLDTSRADDVSKMNLNNDAYAK
jgi:nucleoporin p58/p45